MKPQFSPLAPYDKLPEQPLRSVGDFDPTTAPVSTWMIGDGCPARTGRGSEPLIHDRFIPAWRVPLDGAEAPSVILSSGDLIVVQGQSSRGIWNLHGRPLGIIPRGSRPAWLDPAGPRLVMDHAEGGFYSFALPSCQLESHIMLAKPSDHKARQILPGPANLMVLLTTQRAPTHEDDAVVEVVSIRDWGDVQNGIFYGYEPVAGLIREQDCQAEAALGPGGPVLASPDGIVWTDWRLRVLAEHRHSLTPVAMCVDGSHRAFVLGQDHGQAMLTIVPPGGPAQATLNLPNLALFEYQPPFVSSDGGSFVLLPGELIALTPMGAVAWRQPCGANPRGMLCANGLLLLADGDLFAVTASGDRFCLWTPPRPLSAAPLLARGHILAATNDELFLLAPAT